MENLGLGKVLLVEDDEKLAGLIEHFLAQHGFDVRVVHRGDEALAAFLAFKPKIVVLDLMLPGQSGLHVCREIRNVSMRWPAQPPSPGGSVFRNSPFP